MFQSERISTEASHTFMIGTVLDDVQRFTLEQRSVDALQGWTNILKPYPAGFCVKYQATSQDSKDFKFCFGKNRKFTIKKIKKKIKKKLHLNTACQSLKPNTWTFKETTSI